MEGEGGEGQPSFPTLACAMTPSPLPSEGEKVREVSGRREWEPMLPPAYT